eukprot:2298378-Rhodomonas_salina.2
MNLSPEAGHCLSNLTSTSSSLLDPSEVILNALLTRRQSQKRCASTSAQRRGAESMPAEQWRRSGRCRRRPPSTTELH